MKKYIFLLLTILLVFSGNVSAQPKSNSAGLTEKDFMKAVLKSDEFKEFKSSILKDASTQPKALIDEKENNMAGQCNMKLNTTKKKFP